jgi:hypothetical protein
MYAHRAHTAALPSTPQQALASCPYPHNPKPCPSTAHLPGPLTHNSHLLNVQTHAFLYVRTCVTSLPSRPLAQVAIQLPSTFSPSCLCHPDTYLNKVVVGSEQGGLQLWNFATGRLLFEFRGWGSGVRCLAPSPALDVVGVGLADG